MAMQESKPLSLVAQTQDSLGVSESRRIHLPPDPRLCQRRLFA